LGKVSNTSSKSFQAADLTRFNRPVLPVEVVSVEVGADIPVGIIEAPSPSSTGSGTDINIDQSNIATEQSLITGNQIIIIVAGQPESPKVVLTVYSSMSSIMTLTLLLSAASASSLSGFSTVRGPEPHQPETCSSAA
jgi:hypothetical protein